MNIFMGPLKICFRVMGVRSRGAIQLSCQLNKYKYFSVNYWMHCKNNNQNDGYFGVFDTEDFEERIDNKKNVEFQSDVPTSGNKMEQDMNFHGDMNESYNIYPGRARHRRGEEDFHPESESYDKYRNRNNDKAQYFPMQTVRDYSKKFGVRRHGFKKELPSSDYRNLKWLKDDEPYTPTHFDRYIFSMSAKLPLNCPVLRNQVFQSNILVNDNIFHVQGQQFLSIAYLNNVYPLKIFYCDQNQLQYLKFNPQFVEYYFVSHKDMLRTFHTAKICAIFKKDSVIEKANSKQRDLPVSIVVHNIQDANYLNEIVHGASFFSCEKLMSTYGSSKLYTNEVINFNEKSFFLVPVYDQVTWDKIESGIDPHLEIFLINPNGKTSSSTTPKKSQSIRLVDIFSTDIWTKKKILIIFSAVKIEEDEELLQFCKNWNVKKLISTNLVNASLFDLFTGILGEIKRQHYYKFPCSQSKSENVENKGENEE